MKRIARFGVVLAFAFLASASLPQEASQQVFAPQTARDWQVIGESVVHAPMPQIAYVINGSVFVMNEDGTNVRLLSGNRNSWQSDPAFSPDGSQLAFAMGNSIRVLNLRTGEERVIPVWIAQGMDWSPDGRVFAYGHFDGGIALVNADGSNDHVIVTASELLRLNALGVGSLSFSPDGKRIVFVCVASPGLYVVNADGTGLKQLTASKSGEIRMSPSFDPTGTKIAYGYYRGAYEDKAIRVINTDGTDDTAIYKPSNSTSDLAWSPDGGKIVFDEVVRERGGLYGIARAGDRWSDLGMIFRGSDAVRNITWFDPRYAKPVATAPWDVNRDSVTDIRDLILVARHFGESGTLDADVNGDRVVDIRDLILVATHFGEGVLAAPQRIALVERLSKARSDEDVQSILNELSPLPTPMGKRIVRWAELKSRP